MSVLAADSTVMAAAVEVAVVGDTDVAAQIDMALVTDAAGGTAVAEQVCAAV